MTNSIAEQVAEALRHRQRAVGAVTKAQAQYEIAVLDHVTARIRAAYPDTTHLTFEHFSHNREVELRALWAIESDGAERRVLDARLDMTSLDVTELDEDLTTALAGHDSVAWSAVRPEPVGRHWILDLPPYDRATRIAELVRAHHPDAQLLTLDLADRTPRITSVTVVNATELNLEIHARGDRPLWPDDTDRSISGLVRQIQALPHLRARYLARVGGPRDHTAFFLLPQPKAGEE